MSNIILVAETGSDIPSDMARERGIHLVPMHVSLGEQSFEDGTFPPEEICQYYARTGVLAKTSASSPSDFSKVFDEIHAEWPEKEILHLAYSAVTTASYQSGIEAGKERSYVASVDTKQASFGQGSVVLRMAELLEKSPNMTLPEAVAAAEKLSLQTRMCFLPDDLEYLRAGGRVSNAVCLVGRLLSLHPRIELINGRLVGTKKMRGSMEKLVPSLVLNYTKEKNLNRSRLWLLRSVGLLESVCYAAEKAASELGFQNVTWIRTGCVITAHAGPGAFGMVGFNED